MSTMTYDTLSYDEYIDLKKLRSDLHHLLYTYIGL